jgi:hypothetical protein
MMRKNRNTFPAAWLRNRQPGCWKVCRSGNRIGAKATSGAVFGIAQHTWGDFSSNQGPMRESGETRNPDWNQAEMEELRKIRRLQVLMNMVMSVISQDVNLTVEEASEMVADAKRAALAMFPDKELAYDLIYKPRLQRLMRERYRLQ